MPIRSLTLTSLLLIFFCTNGHAQVSVGLEAGPDFPRMLNIIQGYNASGGSVTMNSQAITRFAGGILADIPMDKKRLFIIRPSVMYLGAGGATPQIVDLDGNQQQPATHYYLEYVQMPIQLLYSPSIPIGKLWIGGGFYGAVLFNAMAGNAQNPQFLEIGGGSNDNVKRFDMGFSTTAGLTLNCGILIGVDFQQGVNSVVPNQSPGSPAIRNSIWALHIGYMNPGRK